MGQSARGSPRTPRSPETERWLVDYSSQRLVFFDKGSQNQKRGHCVILPGFWNFLSKNWNEV